MATGEVLLDTHAFLWAITDDRRLGPKARKAFLDESLRLRLSAASVWEMAIKSSLGKLSFDKSLDAFLDEQLVENKISMLDLSRTHAALVETLPFHHRDPFDRVLIAQAILEKTPIVSSDTQFDAYAGVRRIW